MRVIWIIAEALLAVAGYLFTFGLVGNQKNRVIAWIRDHKWLARVWVIVVIIITVGVLIRNKNESNRNLNQITTELRSVKVKCDSITADFATLQAKDDSVMAICDTLSSQLGPFIAAAAELFPELEKEAALDEVLSHLQQDITSIAKDVSVIPPHMEQYTKQVARDSATGLIHTIYYYRPVSNPAASAGDVIIHLRFKTRFRSARAYSICDIKVGGEYSRPDDDFKGVTYSTNILHASCIVRIEIYSEQKLIVEELTMKP